jgi:hypothetical protein
VPHTAVESGSSRNVEVEVGARNLRPTLAATDPL